MSAALKIHRALRLYIDLYGIYADMTRRLGLAIR